MFIPRGEIVHENLATSYVLLDELVADLSENDFSGAVEVRLQETDGFIIIINGDVSAVVEKRDEPGQSASVEENKHGSVSELAARARLEQGRVSVYGYSADIANAVAGLINAEPLYPRLSIEFTNLEKTISKLAREVDREWFVEVNTTSGLSGLLHLIGSRCQLIESTEPSDNVSGSPDPAKNPALRKFLDSCRHDGGTFGVYLKRSSAETSDAPADRRIEATSVTAPSASNKLANDRLATLAMPTDSSSVSSADRAFLSSSKPFDYRGEKLADDLGPLRASISAKAPTPGVTDAPSERAAPEGLNAAHPGARPDEASSGEELSGAGVDEAMWELKRMMGEIARAIEGAAQAVDHHDSFSMSLRAGQIKVADQYPFLDPFRNEFEYLDGEIVFVGQATSEEFVAGLTAALELAILGVAQSTEYGERFRGYVIEDLRKLLVRDRSELDRFGLDQVIEHLLTTTGD